MKQYDAVNTIVESLKKDDYVKAIFLKGSMGRGEEDQHSDVDLYVLVEEQNEQVFLENRLMHLRAYGELLFYDDIFIIAPQIIAVYDNMLHLDLFTVTEKTFKEKDYFKVLFDPEGRLQKFDATQNLTLTYEEYRDDVMDVAWFLFQYKKSKARENDIWSISMLHHTMTHLARVLLHNYCPNRAQLGLKTLEATLPQSLKRNIHIILQYITPKEHKHAEILIQRLVANEVDWIISTLNKEDQMKLYPFLSKMIIQQEPLSK
ncbi:nucleotidyltransferase domain-containing protein [Salirhabdus sp. Marseille-P4669]|uniref:nucleotidyltransferase domain-containing protein n=1 Tax=Salirhabdus sp. Marseille-P4669 TaxID=2042310 RepID=UPI000C7E0DB7|nr:nucleotidyltransferase domain-containing protein [Salirhabdus sp. Marseille-P4669]